MTAIPEPDFLTRGEIAMDDKTLVQRLRALKWQVLCEMRGLVDDTTAYEAADTIEALQARIEALEAENAAAGRNVYLLQTQNARFSALLKEAVTTSVRCTLNEQWLKSAKQALESQP